MHAPQTPCSQPDVGAGQAQVVAQHVGQQPAGRDLRLARHAVDDEPDVVALLGHAAAVVVSPARPAASASARAVSTRTRWRR